MDEIDLIVQFNRTTDSVQRNVLRTNLGYWENREAGSLYVRAAE